MDEIVEKLKEIGLNEYQSKVYIALLKKFPAKDPPQDCCFCTKSRGKDIFLCDISDIAALIYLFP